MSNSNNPKLNQNKRRLTQSNVRREPITLNKKRRIDCVTANKPIMLSITPKLKDKPPERLPNNVQFTGKKFTCINNSMVQLTPDGRKPAS